LAGVELTQLDRAGISLAANGPTLIEIREDMSELALMGLN